MTLTTPTRLYPSARYDPFLAMIARKKRSERYHALAEILRAARHHSPYRIDPRGAAKKARIRSADLERMENGIPIAAMTVAPLQRLANVYEAELSITLDGKTFSYQATTALACVIAAGGEIMLLSCL